ncbi:SDR family NAD(P)-dependent oxidoreductase [Saccharopolyspora rhizosphaerae]|uniref:SDR family NAD(P)-dependent oxidoreductase n=1 Tax=Saccharopolyspora rhizosphaerae TaxID=2492662 RepID=A0A426K0C4_9PSEU|nr:SDR family NAD(P)-dependent oxidoreductase [Saccharopolyspora rhizosphaerae]RRO18891.1 SDR family NAD(P)-dependent oxidoreductase [Saccharopolyspora rhizosphaerae]
MNSALVTGASSGIGAATALRLSADGWRVVLTGRDRPRLDALADRTGGRAVAADLTTADGMRRVVEAARGVELLVHSAGIGWAGPFEAMAPHQIDELLELNLTIPIRLTHALLPPRVAFVASVAAVGVRDEDVYSATKAGLRAFAASLRYRGVTTTTAFPGAVRTPFFHGRRYDRRFPRMLEPERVADALVDAVARGQPEVFVPRWLAVADRLHGAVPGLFHRLARRFG